MGDNDSTRIALDVDTREALKARKVGDDTYDDVVRRLLDGDGTGDGTLNATAEITPTLDEDALADLVDEVEGALSKVEIDDEGIEDLARAVAASIDYTEIADKAAAETARRLRS